MSLPVILFWGSRLPLPDFFPLFCGSHALFLVKEFFFLKYRNSLPVATSELPCISPGLRATHEQFCASVKWEMRLWESSDAEVSLCY